MSHVKYMKRIVTDDVREQRMNLCDLMDGEDINTKGETFEELDERIRRFIAHITTLQGSNTKIVVFTHCLFIRRLVEIITTEDPGKIEYGGSVTLDL
jgi:broad specificity phosphatase PhoE